MNSKFMLNLRRALPAVAAIGGAAIAAGVASYLYGSLVEARRYHLEMVRIRIPRDVNGAASVPPRTPLRVLHISDLHLAQPESHKVEFLRRITSMDYDMIVLTGDVFEDYTGLQYAEALLKRRPRYGAYAVLGNHDYYDYSYFNKFIGRIWRKFRHPLEKRQVDPLVEALEKVGYKVLRHQSVEIPEARLQVIGIDYPGIAGGALKKLVDEAPEDYLRLALLHVPHNLNILPDAGIDVAFAGHTHGGQVRIPGIGAIITDSELHRKEASGVVYRKHTAIHVSRGLGADPKTNFRIFCPPAATVIHVDQ